jgi:PAS domain S-box-containing protein
MSTTLRLLILEDDPRDAELMVAALEGAGHVCRWDRVETQADFLARLAPQPPDYDLILADYNLPSLDALTALQLFLRKDLDLPFILVSGTLGELTAIEALKMGAADYVLKSHLYRLAPVVRRALRESEDRRRRRHAEQSLRESEDRFRSLIEAAPIVILHLSSDYRILEFNPEAERLYGRRREDVIGANYLELFLPEDERDRVAADIGKVITGEPTRDFENPVRAADGQLHDMVWNADRLVGCQGQLTGIIAVGQDITKRKQVREALERSEERFRALVETGTHGILLLDKAGAILYGSPSLTQMLGYEEGTADRLSFSQFLHPDDLEEVVSLFNRLVASPGTMDQTELRVRHRDGSWRYAEVLGTNRLDDEAVEAVVINIRDITERKQAEGELRVKDSALASSLSSIAMMDLSGNLTYVNRAWLEMTGHNDAKQVIGRPITDFFASQEDAGQAFQGLLEEGQWSGDMVAKTKDGSPFDLHLSASVTTDEAGKPICVMTSGVDISDRTAAESELRREKSIADMIISSLPGVFYMFTEEGKFVRWNASLQEITGYSHDEVSSMSPLDFFVDEDKAIVANRMQDVFSTGRSTVEATALTKSGQRLYYVFTGVRADIEGTPYLIGVGIDIAERKRAEEELGLYRDHLEQLVEQRTQELEEAQEQLLRQERLTVLGQLSSSVGHELRNPLGVIKNAAYFLNMKLRADADKAIKENVDIINREVNIATRIITDLLDLARVSPPLREDVDLRQLLTETLSRSSIPNNVTVATAFGENMAPVYVDPLQMSQIFANLTQNALQAMAEGGTLTISTRESNGVPEVVFIDDGCGIPQANLKKIFEPLYTTKPRGIGLGLTLSNNLAKANDAVIFVESREGEGSTFTVRFGEST